MHKFNPNLCGESRNLNLTRTQSVSLASRGWGQNFKKSWGRPANSERRPLTNIAHNAPRREAISMKFYRNLQNKISSPNLRLAKFVSWFLFLLGREGAPIARSYFSQGAASAAPHCSARPQAPPIPYDASDTDCVRVFSFNGLRYILWF